MFQPGKETNIPSSSGAPMGLPPLDFAKTTVASVNSYVLTLGALVLFVAALWVYFVVLKGRK